METNPPTPTLPTPGLPGVLFRAQLDVTEARRRAGRCNERAALDPTYRLARLAMPACW